MTVECIDVVAPKYQELRSYFGVDLYDGMDDGFDPEPLMSVYKPDPATESMRLDLNKASRSRRVKELVDALYPVVAGGKGVSPKHKEVQRHLKLCVLNLYVAWMRDQWVAYAGTYKAYTATAIPRRYNTLRVTRQIPIIMRALEKAGFTEIKTGFKDKKTGVGFTNRAKATERLIDLFESIDARLISTVRERECILLNKKGVDEHGKPKGNILLDYADTTEIMRMRGNLNAYNALISRTEITFDEFMTQFTGRVDLTKRFTYRVFNHCSFDVGGRFYGPWWVTLRNPETDIGKWNMRRYIQINGNPVVELDYSAQHPALLYASKGLELPNDPYRIDGYDRSVIKHAVLISLNASSRSGASSAMRKWVKEKREKTGLLEKYQFSPKIMDAIERKHEPITEFFYTGAWKHVQRQDSVIAEGVMNHFTAQGIPVLMVHDSFLVEEQYELELREVMVREMRKVMGSEENGMVPVIKRGW